MEGDIFTWRSVFAAFSRGRRQSAGSVSQRDGLAWANVPSMPETERGRDRRPCREPLAGVAREPRRAGDGGVAKMGVSPVLPCREWGLEPIGKQAGDRATTTLRAMSEAEARPAGASAARDSEGHSRASVIVQVPIDLLVLDASPRLCGEDEGHVHLLAESISALPPIVVHRATMRVIDGAHRVRAARLSGRRTIAAEYFDGDDHEAFVLSVQANIAHGLPLTTADRKAAAERIVDSYPSWSDRAIAKVTGLSPKTVGALRPRPGVDDAAPSTRIGLDGRVRPVDHRTSRRRAAEYMAGHPGATADDLMRVSGLSRRTVRKVLSEQATGDEARAQPLSSVPIDDHRSADARELTCVLRRDPSLRFSESGRAFLRMLGAAALWDENAERMIDELPPHCIGTLAEAVRNCARTVRNIAEKLEAREKEGASRKAATE